MSTSKSEILKKWYQDIWVDGNLDAIPKYMAPESDALGLMPDMNVNGDDMRDMVTILRTSLGEMHFTYPIMIEQDDWLAAVVEVHSENAENNDPIYTVSHVMARFDDGLMVEVYNSIDFLTFFEQMGQLPENALAMMLSGMTIK